MRSLTFRAWLLVFWHEIRPFSKAFAELSNSPSCLSRSPSFSQYSADLLSLPAWAAIKEKGDIVKYSNIEISRRDNMAGFDIFFCLKN